MLWRTNSLLTRNCCQGFNKEQFLDLWRIEANDVVLCMDADTGKTLWRKVFADGLYHDDWGKPRNANNTPLQATERSSFTVA